VLAEERQAIALQKLKDAGYLEVVNLARSLDVCPATIRRDLEHLQQEGRVMRVRGGAVSAMRSTSLEPPYEVKRHRHIEEKLRIATAASQMVHDGETVILDAGSTTYQIAVQLLHRRNLTVVTNDLQIAVKLASNPNITLICTGGIARANVYSLLGHQTEAFLRTLRVNTTFLGADALHPDGTVANVVLDEVAIKQAMLNAGEHTVVVADSSKFAVTGLARVCSLQEVDLLVTDTGIPKEMLKTLREMDVSVTIV
jgi:DeoR family transcriptional regulator of aga operon